MKITLCGSTRFFKEYNEWNKKLTLDGHIIYSVAMFGKEATDTGKEYLEVVTAKQKMHLDLIHLIKIEESDAIVVLNVGGYIGDSTKREIAWARLRGKEVYWVENSGEIDGELLADDIEQ